MSTPPMPDIRHLVVLGTTVTGLAVVRGARAAGLTCDLVDVRAGIASRTRHARTTLVDRTDAATVLATLTRLAASGPCALVADSDAWLRFVVAHHDALKAVFAVILHPRPESLATCLDKNTFVEWCARHGVPAPRRHDVGPDGRLVPAAEFPLLIRPETTLHGAGLDLPKAIEVRDPASLDRWLRRFAEARVQPAVSQSLLRPGIRQFSIGVARDRDGRTRTLVAEKLRSYADQCAGGTFVVSSEHAGAEALAHRVLDALDYFGIAEVEVMCDPATGECFVIEVNARPWAQYALAEHAGLDFLGFLLWQRPLAEGRPRRLRWLNFEGDAYGCLARSGGIVRHGRLGWWAWLKSLLSANVFAFWDRRDPAPFFHQLQGLVGGRLAQSFRKIRLRWSSNVAA
jgi:predicted ATP-grasp superfamily ATP-dependent carboligase